jgi:predicted dehydrogenase
MHRTTNRRQFLKQTALAGVGFWVAGSAEAAPAREGSGGDKLKIACIGVGGKGSSDTDQAGKHGVIVALCDIDDRFLDRKAERFPKAKKYNDFRKLFDEMGKDIDAVVVSTPDHTHAPAAMMALKHGKHVYCQKPLTHTVYEARALREEAARRKVATQMGNQGTANSTLRRAVEIIQAGAIGPVREVHVWTNRPIWPQAPDVTSRPGKSDPVPKYVHWDEWLGPAPERPFVENTYHDFKWRGWWDFGTGALGDMGCHTANLPFMALRLEYPTSIVAENGDVNPETYPGWAIVHYEFPARGDLPPVRMTWYEGKRNGQRVLPPADLVKGQEVTTSGSILVGEKGTLYSPHDYGGSYKLLPEKDFEGYKGPPQRLPRNGREDEGMKIEWLAAAKGGPKPMSNFGYAGLLTETILLGNVAIRAGKKLEWDGPNFKVTNYPEANQFLHYEYRKGWTL